MSVGVGVRVSVDVVDLGVCVFKLHFAALAGIAVGQAANISCMTLTLEPPR